jgi:ech hydrogenase subunit D
MKRKPRFISIDKSELLGQAAQMSRDSFRLVHICCTTLEEGFEITYSFAKGYKFVDYRVTLPRAEPTLPSITGTYLCAFTYENELNDLFGITVTDNALDFKGTFYRMAVKTPFATIPPKAAPKVKGAVPPEEQVQ